MTRSQFARARRIRPLVGGTLVSAATFVFAACSSESSGDGDESGGAPTGGGGSAGAANGGSVAGSSSGGTGGSGATGGSGTGGSGATGGKSGGAGGLGGSASGGDAGASSGRGGAAPGGSAGMAGNGGRGGNPSSTCPETPPNDASSCGSAGLACFYEDCGGDGRTVARCLAGAWDVENGACAAPICEADGCDAGDVCIGVTGGTVIVNCVSNPCGTGPVTCDCVGCERCIVDGSLSSGIAVVCSP